MARERPWTEAEKAYAIKNWGLGYTYTQIAQELNRSRNAVAGALRRMQTTEQRSRAKPRDAAAPIGAMRRIDQVAELLSEGFAFTDIANELGIKREAVVSCFKRIKAGLGWQAQ